MVLVTSAAVASLCNMPGEEGVGAKLARHCLIVMTSLSALLTEPGRPSMASQGDQLEEK